MDFIIRAPSQYKEPAKDATIIATAFLLGRAYSALNLGEPLSYLGNVAPLVVTALKVREYINSAECYSPIRTDVTIAETLSTASLLYLSLFEAWYISSFGLLSLFRVVTVAFFSFSRYPPKITSLKEFDPSSWELKKIQGSLSSMQNLEKLTLPPYTLTSLPPETAQLTNLTALRANDASLRNLPSLSNLTRLEELQVNHNELKRLPEDISELTNLTRLDACYNQLRRLPENFSRLTNLEDLRISGNPLQPLHPFTSFVKLRRLDYNIFHIGQIRMLTNLKELYINNCSHVPQGLSTFTKLRKLKIIVNSSVKRISNSERSLYTKKRPSYDDKAKNLYSELLALKKLEELTASYLNITDIRKIALNLTALKWLDLQHNQIQNLPVEVSRLTNLTHLDLSYNKIKYIPGWLTPGRLPRLKTLKIRRNPLNATPRPVERFAPDVDGNDQGVPSLKEAAARRVALLQSRPAHSA